MTSVDRDIDDLSAILQNQPELDEIGAEILERGHAIRYRERRVGGKSMVFVARHDDVFSVLTNECRFSVRHYDPLYTAVGAPHATLIMRPEGPGRTDRLKIFHAAAGATPWFKPCPADRRELAQTCVDEILADVSGRRRRRFDVISEYGFLVPYRVANELIGLPGPRSFSLLALLIWLANRHSFFRFFSPKTRPYVTELAWSEVVIAQLLINFGNRSGIIRAVARCGASRLRAHTERHVDALRSAPDTKTLIGALWAVRDVFADEVKSDVVYREHVVSIVMELLSTLLLVPGEGFFGILDRWLAPGGAGLEQSLRQLDQMDAEVFVQEQLRLAPPSAHLLRNVEHGSIELGGLKLEEGEYVCALVKSAGIDIPNVPRVVRPGRSACEYLHFGPVGGPHRCLGHLLAPSILAEMFLGLHRLPGLAAHGRPSACLGTAPGRLIVDFGKRAGTAP